MLLTGAGAFPVSFAVLFFCYFLLFCFLLFCFGSRVVEVVVCRRGDFLVRFQFGVGVFSGSVFLLLDLVWTLTDLRCGGGGCRIFHTSSLFNHLPLLQFTHRDFPP
jgi:hypothetical protein